MQLISFFDIHFAGGEKAVRLCYSSMKNRMLQHRITGGMRHIAFF